MVFILRIIYNLLFYILFFPALIFVLIKAPFDPRYRYRLTDRLGFSPRKENKKVIWCHAASVGEVLMAIPLLKKMEYIFPDYDIFVSTQTPSGYETVVSKLKSKVKAFLIPIDTFDAVNRSINRIQPSLFLLFETELWANLLYSLAHRNIPIVLLNGRFSHKSFNHYKLFKSVLKILFNNFNAFAMQSEEDVHKIIALGADESKVFKMGNMKFDRTLTTAGGDIELIVKNLLTNSGKFPLLVYGSIHLGEFPILMNVFLHLKENLPDLKLIWAPRHIEELTESEKILNSNNIVFFKRSEANRLIKKGKSADVMILDSYGELASIYSFATIVFIGGSLIPHGGQNMLEAAYFKKPIVFGADVKNFQEIADLLLNYEAACQIQNEAELTNCLIKLLQDEQIRSNMGNKAFELLSQHKGAVDRAIKLIKNVLQNHDDNN